MIGHWLYHWLGIAGTGPQYGFWSGFGSDLAYFGALFGFYYKHNCHRERCWRIAKHTVDGTPWCGKHHESARKPKEA